MNSISMTKRVFMLFSVPQQAGGPIGTGFCVDRPDIILTADHVVGDTDPSDLLAVCTFYSPLAHIYIKSVERHPEADVAALVVEGVRGDQELENFVLGSPSSAYRSFDEYPLGEDVLAYGFPMMGMKGPSTLG